MSPAKQENFPKGSMRLSHSQTESGDEDWENFETTGLEAADGKIVLVESVRSTNALKNSNTKLVERYEIDTATLIEFVKSRGIKIF